MDTENIIELYEEMGDDLKFIISSDIKSKIIISLKEGSKKLNSLKEEVHINSSTVLHNMSKFENRGLIVRGIEGYSLSQTGLMVALNLVDMVNTISTIQKDKNYWLNHNIDGLPEDLINRLRCLKESKIESPFINYGDLLKRSKNLKVIIPTLNFLDEFLKIYNKNMKVDLILNKNLDELIKSDAKLNNIMHENNLELLKTNLKVALILDDKLMSLNLPLINGKYNLNEFLVNRSTESINWGNKLFEYYLMKSK